MDDSAQSGIFDDPQAFLQMGRGLIERGRGAAAMALAEQAVAERPGDRLLAALAHELAAWQVPDFHAIMLEDEGRNRAYRAAIEALAPGQLVLDIGTGSGLLSMCAARARAAAVHACERDARLARTATNIIAANGYAEAIKVHAAASQDLDAARDLGGGADLVVTEIFDENLLREGFIASVGDARERLCRPGARFLPERAAIRVALAAVADPPDPPGTVEGFDLAAFTRHIPPEIKLRQGSKRLALRSAPADLYAFDLAAPIAESDSASVRMTVSGGPATGLVQWIRLDLAPGIAFENAPGTQPDSHWRLVYHHLPALKAVRAGQTVELKAWRDQTDYWVWL
jgi:hypothetical protein